jgi:predicted nucleic acid-binding protein
LTLCDTGPLVALIDRGDPHHERCVTTLDSLPPEPLLTTWPCWVEAIYLVGRVKGFASQEALWSYLAGDLVRLVEPAPGEWQRMRALMRRYRDVPMDIADASLVTAAERLTLRRIFTLDSHFFAYRIGGKDGFEVVPSPTLLER